MYLTAWWEMKLSVVLEAALEVAHIGDWEITKNALQSIGKANMATAGDKLTKEKAAVSITQKGLSLHDGDMVNVTHFELELF